MKRYCKMIPKYASGASMSNGELSSIYSLAGDVGANALEGKQEPYTLQDSNLNQGRMIGSNMLRYGSKGAAIGSAFGGVGTAIGAGVGAIGGALLGNKDFKNQTKDYNTWKTNTLDNITQRGISNYNTNIAMGFKPQGNRYTTFGDGGFIPQYEVEKNEVIQGSNVKLSDGGQVSNNMHLAEGVTHDEVNPTTGTTGVLGTGGDRVFSNRSTLLPETIQILKALKVPVKNNDTHAKVALTVAKKESKFQDKVHSVSLRERNSSNQMLQRYSTVKDIIFQDQEIQKPQEEQMTQPQFAKGGRLPRYDDGVLLTNNSKTAKGFNWNNSDTNYEDIVPSTPTTAQIQGGNESNSSSRDMWGTTANTLNLANNLISVNKLKSFNNPEMPIAPVMRYNTNLPYNIYENAKAGRTALKNMNRYGANPNNKYAVANSVIEGNNKVFTEDNMRRGDFNNQVSMVKNQIDNQGVQIRNAVNQGKIDLNNTKVTERNNAVNVWATGEMQNKYHNDQIKLEDRSRKLLYKNRYGNIQNRLYTKLTDEELQNELKDVNNNEFDIQNINKEISKRKNKQ